MAESESLAAVYGARSPEEIARTYDAWAEGYDAEMACFGYRHPAIALALLARYVPRGAGPILDAGAGTGLIGEWLAIAGYPVADALDLSPGMLAVAARKGVYRGLTEAALGRPLPFPDDAYAAAVCAGVFTTGHVGPEGLDELIRVVRPGGALVLTVKDTVWNDGFAARLDALAQAGVLERREETPAYHSMPGSADAVPSRGVVLGVA